jgi:hypothetical protein
VREKLSLWPGTVAIYDADDKQMQSPINMEHQEWLNNYSRATVPSIHMPKWACRLWLEVKSVKVERVQEIGVDDITAEGINDGLEA